MLVGAGFEWYEISNWACPGAAAPTTSCTGPRASTAGVGCAAHSHLVGPDGTARRWWNVRTPERYCGLVETGSGRGGGETLGPDAARLGGAGAQPADLGGRAGQRRARRAVRRRPGRAGRAAPGRVKREPCSPLGADFWPTRWRLAELSQFCLDKRRSLPCQQGASGAGDGEDGRPPARPARRAAGHLLVRRLSGAKPGRPEGEEPEYDLAEELPTMPPPSAGAEPALRWAEVGPLPDPGTGPEGLLYGPPRGPPPRPAGRQPSGAAVANPPPGSVPSPGGGALTYPDRLAPRRRPGPPATGAVRTHHAALPRGANGRLGEGAMATAPLRPDGCHHHARRSPRRGRAIFWLVALVVFVAASVSAAIVLAGREAIDHRPFIGDFDREKRSSSS